MPMPPRETSSLVTAYKVEIHAHHANTARPVVLGQLYQCRCIINQPSKNPDRMFLLTSAENDRSTELTIVYYAWCDTPAVTRHTRYNNKLYRIITM